MSQSPGKRTTRSNSNTGSSITLADIKALNQANKDEIVSSIKSDLNGIKDLLKLVLERVDNLDKRCAKFEDRCSKLEENSNTQLSTIAEEVENRYQRRKNAIVFGLELKSEGSLEERKADDIEKCSEMLSKISVDTDDVDDVYRIGRPGKAGRSMLKIKFVSSEAKQTAIRNSRQLRDSHPNVFLAPDRTPQQQSEHKALVTEMKSRREAGEDVVFIEAVLSPENPGRIFNKDFKCWCIHT